MATITLDDVTIELMQANVTLENIDNNTTLANEFLNLSVDTFKKGFGDMLEFFKGNSLANLEREREQAEFNKDMLAALQDLKPEYTGPDKAPVPKDADFGLGGLLMGLAITIGAVIGVIKGQLLAIKLFAKTISNIGKSIASIIPDFIKNFFKGLAPTKLIALIRKTITSFVAGLTMGFDLLKASLMEKLSGISRFFTGVFDDIVRFFSGESKIFSGLKNAFTTLIEPFKELFGMVKGVLAGPFAMVGEMFAGIGRTLSSFGAMIGKVAGIVGKIFLPLTIIITVYDTIKGFIEGFEKEGIVGGIAGAIKGFFNSLIFGPVDMLKDATAWVLGFFGLDKAKEFLKSFSFEDIFTTLVDAIFSPIDTLKKMLDGVVSFFTDIGNKLTGFISGFEIPGFSILGKQFGPWKPFSGKASSASSSSSSSDADIKERRLESREKNLGKTTSERKAHAEKLREEFKAKESAKNGTTQAASAPTKGGTAGIGAVPTQSSLRIAGEQVVPGAPLSQKQMAVIEASKSMGNTYPPEVEAQYRKQKSEAVSAPSSNNGTAVQSGQQLQTASQENGMLNAAPGRSGGNGGGGGNVSQSNSTTVVNNSTVVVKPIPSATRRPNNSEDIFFRGAAAGFA